MSPSNKLNFSVFLLESLASRNQPKCLVCQEVLPPREETAFEKVDNILIVEAKLRKKSKISDRQCRQVTRNFRKDHEILVQKSTAELNSSKIPACTTSCWDCTKTDITEDLKSQSTSFKSKFAKHLQDSKIQESGQLSLQSIAIHHIHGCEFLGGYSWSACSIHQLAMEFYPLPKY